MNLQALMQGFYARMDGQHDFAAVDDVCHDDLSVTTPMGVFNGKETYKQFAISLYEAMPDMVHVPSSWVESGDTLAFEVEMNGTFTNPLQSPQGAIPPTGKPVTLRGADFLTFAGGRIKGWRIYLDPDVFPQLGLA